MRSLLSALAVAAMVATSPVDAVAVDVKCIPMKLVVPFPAGGSNDIAARLVARSLEAQLKVTIVIENKAGAAGNVGTAFVVSAPADGCTLLVHGAALATYPHSFKQLSFDPFTDLVSVGSIGVTPTVLATSNKSIRNLDDLFAWARTKPEGLSYGSAGIGVLNHLAVEDMAEKTKTKLVHVPYRGGGGIPQDVLTGRLDFGSFTLASITQFVASGDMKILALLQPNHTTLAPDAVPTSKQGFANINAGNHMLVLAPAKTPKDVVQAISTALQQAVRQPDLKPQFEAAGIEAIPLTAEETTAFLRQMEADWATVIKRLNIQL
jgi:tripartite-type tricarboxylate transporter receptor subunit TctC